MNQREKKPKKKKEEKKKKFCKSTSSDYLNSRLDSTYILHYGLV